LRNVVTVILLIGLSGLQPTDCLGRDSELELQFFRDRVVPLLFEKCFGCHGVAMKEGGYSVADTNALLQPGDSGAMPAVIDNIDASELLIRLRSKDPSTRMPLDSEPFDDSEIESVRLWIAAGAKIVDNARPTPLVEIYGRSKVSERAPLHYANSLPVSSLLLSPNGRELLVGGYSEVLVWDIERQSLAARLPTRGRMIADMTWGPNGRLVVASGSPGRFGVLEAYDFVPRKQIQTFGFSRDVCSSIAASPFRNELVAGYSDGGVTLFSLDDFTPRIASIPHAAGVTQVSWSSRNNRLFSASLDRTAKSFEATGGQVLSAYADHERAVGSVANTQYGAITLDETGTLRLWSDGDDARSIAKFEGLSQSMQRIAIANEIILVGDGNRIRRLTIVQDEVDDDKPKDTVNEKVVSDKPKKKKRTKIKEVEVLESISDQSIQSISANGRGLVAAGLNNGHVVVWRTDESRTVWKSWDARP
jgi:WD40 repeat protein